MNRTITIILSLLVLLSLLSISAVTAIQFSLKQGEELCLSETITAGELIAGEYNINPVGSRIQCTMSDPSGGLLYSRVAESQLDSTGSKVDSYKFTATAPITGDHRICFSNTQYDTVTSGNPKTVQFTLTTGLGTTDYSALAKKDSLKPIEVELKRLEDTVKTIHNELKYLSDREVTMRSINDSTSTQVVWFSWLTLILLVSLKLAEVIYLKKYFKSKKLIQ